MTTEGQNTSARTFVETGRVPDFVKELPIFDGKPTELINWLTEVHEIFELYKDLPRHSPQYALLERSIRRKICGEAADVLNANNIYTDFSDIKKTLLLYYQDKRDLRTLDYELTTIRKAPTESLGSYYSRVNELLSLIIVCIQSSSEFDGHAESHIKYFKSKALDSFIRGLDRQLSLLLKTANPPTLNRAYQFCLDYYNMGMRSAPFHNEHTNRAIPCPRGLPNYKNQFQQQPGHSHWRSGEPRAAPNMSATLPIAQQFGQHAAHPSEVGQLGRQTHGSRFGHDLHGQHSSPQRQQRTQFDMKQQSPIYLKRQAHPLETNYGDSPAAPFVNNNNDPTPPADYLAQNPAQYELEPHGLQQQQIYVQASTDQPQLFYETGPIPAANAEQEPFAAAHFLEWNQDW
uniref:Gag protein n=1 Tax=Biju errantivirus TaxID=3078397 RepID=A0AB38Z1N7_9VIRU